MDELDQLWVPEVKDWRLNERHYGACIGEAHGVLGAWCSHPLSRRNRVSRMPTPDWVAC